MNASAQIAVVPGAAAATIGRGGAQSRARYPDCEGFVERDGERLFYEVYGEGEETVFLLPTWSLVHSRHWKMQIPYFARHFRVLSMDGLGNGRSDRCRDPRRYRPAEFARDCLAVMDASGTERALMVSVSTGAQYQLELSRLALERVVAAAFIAPWFPYTPSQYSFLLHPWVVPGFQRPLPFYRWWGRFNAAHWREDYAEFAEWFFSRCMPEPHSTKAIEDGVGWALDTDPETLIATGGAFRSVPRDRPTLRALAQRMDHPVLVVHGDRDLVQPLRDGRALARLSGGKLDVAFPQAKERVPDLRMIVVAGPRIDPASLPSHPDLEVVPYVHNLYRHLAACDLAVVQGGLTTSMELTAQKRPFLYFPLNHHFEQNFHVRHRLERYGAGRRMDYESSPPEQIAAAIAQEIGRQVDYRDVEVDGAANAAQRIAQLL